MAVYSKDEGYYPYKVIITLDVGKWACTNRERAISARFTTASQVNEHLMLVKKFNHNWTKIQIFKKGELVKEWQKENIGILTQ